MRFFRFLIMVLVCAGLARPVGAVELEQAHHEHHSTYVTPSDLPPQLLPAPPAENSKEGKKNLEAVITAQKHLSKATLKAIDHEQHNNICLLTDDILGPNFNPDNFPQTARLLKNVFEDTEIVTHADKDFWHTRRPYLVDKRVHLYVKPLDSNPAYPSGHSSVSHVEAEVLALLYPELAAKFRARADDIARHRVQAGAHYPVDIEGGQRLAMQIVGALMKSGDFRSDLEDAQDEVKSVSLAHPQVGE